MTQKEGGPAPTDWEARRDRSDECGSTRDRRRVSKRRMAAWLAMLGRCAARARLTAARTAAAPAGSPYASPTSSSSIPSSTSWSSSAASCSVRPPSLRASAAAGSQYVGTVSGITFLSPTRTPARLFRRTQHAAGAACQGRTVAGGTSGAAAAVHGCVAQTGRQTVPWPFSPTRQRGVIVRHTRRGGLHARTAGGGSKTAGTPRWPA
jgi:hypothetical protein